MVSLTLRLFDTKVMLKKEKKKERQKKKNFKNDKRYYIQFTRFIRLLFCLLSYFEKISYLNTSEINYCYIISKAFMPRETLKRSTKR